MLPRVKPASMLPVADLWAKCCVPIRAPKPGTVRASLVGTSSNLLHVSFATDGRTAAGTPSSESVSCLFDMSSKSVVSTMVNPTGCALAAPNALLVPHRQNTDEQIAFRLSASPKPTAFRCQLDVVSSSSSSSTTKSFIVTDGTSAPKHGELLADAQLQQGCYDQKTNTLYFVVKSNPSVAARQSLEEVIAGSLKSDDDKKKDASDDWKVSSEQHNLGEAYPNITGTEIVRVQLNNNNAAASPSPLLKTEKTIFFDDDLIKPEEMLFSGFPCVVGEDAVAFVSYRVDHPFRGLAHCFAARPNRQFVTCFKSKKTIEINLGENVKQLTSSPFNPLQIAYFDFIPSENCPFGRRPHLSSAALCLAELCPETYQVKKKTVLVDIVRSTSSSSPFPGLYPVFGNGDLVWLDEQTLLVSSVRESAHVLYTVSINNNDNDDKNGIINLASSNYGFWKFMNQVSGSSSLIIALHSSTTTSPCLKLIDISNKSNVNDGNESSSFSVLYNSLPTSSSNANSLLLLPEVAAKTTILPLKSTFKNNSKFGEILFHKSAKSANNGKQRVVVFSHGGPHSADVNAYSRSHHLLLAAGYDIMSVNYRGSLGFGQDGVEMLIGHAGEMEIEDILCSIDQCQEEGLVTKENEKLDLFLSGGSHGGFTSCILAAYNTATLSKNKKFNAAAIRNPVTDISSMRFVTDIGDWCLTEGGVLDDPNADGTEVESRHRMMKHNPILTASKVEIPCILGIGCGDLRVPPFQGRSWANAVRHNKFKPEVQVIEYEKDSHGLETPTTESEFAIQTVMFFNKFSS